MAGEVWEWVQDWYHASYEGASTDGSAWEKPAGSHRVLRGGCWHSDGASVRSTNRSLDLPSAAFGDNGFRPARSLER